MKSAVLVLGYLYLTTAAPVDEHHDRRTRDASEEQLEILLRQVKETLANVNNKPQAVAQTSVQPKPPINSPQAPQTPPVQPTTHQGASAPQIYFFIAHPQLPQALVPGQEVVFSPPGPALPQQGGAVDPSQLPQAAVPGLPQAGVAIPGLPQAGMAIPGLPQAGMAVPGLPQAGVVVPGLPQAGVAIPGLPQAGVAIPVTIPSQEQSIPLTQFYLQPLSPLSGQVQYLYVSPYNTYSPPAVAFTPPFMFRDTAALTPPGQ